MAGEGAGFLGDAFLKAAVAGKGDDVVVKNPVCSRVEARLAHLARNSEPNGIRNALAKRTGGGFDAWGLMVFWMARCDAMKLAERLHIIERHGIPRKMKP